MDELMMTVNEQLQQLQMLMHRANFHHFGAMHSPHRGQGRVLALLKMKPEISQKELTYLLNMSKQAVAELIAKLEKSGYIVREPSEEDRRSMTIKLTEAGASAAPDAGDDAAEVEKIFACLDDEELEKFSEYLERILARYEEQFPDADFEQRRQKMEDFLSSHGSGFDHRRNVGFRGHGPRFGRRFSRCGHGSAEMRHRPFPHGGAGNGGEE